MRKRFSSSSYAAHRPLHTLAAAAVPQSGQPWRRLAQLATLSTFAACLWAGLMPRAQADESLREVAASWVAASAAAQLCSMDWDDRREEMAKDLAMALTREVGRVEVDTGALVRSVSKLISAVDAQATQMQENLDANEIDCDEADDFVEHLRASAHERLILPNEMVLGPRV